MSTNMSMVSGGLETLAAGGSIECIDEDSSGITSTECKIPAASIDEASDGAIWTS